MARRAAGDRCGGSAVTVGAAAACCELLHLRPDLRQPRRRHDRAFLFLAGRPRDGDRRRTQRGAGRDARGRAGPLGQADDRARAGTKRQEAEEQRMTNDGLMQGKRGLIMGLANDKSLAWGIAKKLRRARRRTGLLLSGRSAREARAAARRAASAAISCSSATCRDMEALDAAFATLRGALGRRSTSWSTPSAFPTRTSCAANTSTPASTTS